MAGRGGGRAVERAGERGVCELDVVRCDGQRVLTVLVLVVLDGGGWQRRWWRRESEIGGQVGGDGRVDMAARFDDVCLGAL